MYITDEIINLQKFFSDEFSRSCGAVASFAGIVRNHDHGRAVKSLYYDCYRSMAEKMIKNLIEEAEAKWDVDEIRVLHRVGYLKIGETAVAIAVSSAHRDEAFQGCRSLIERIKKEVPIWKKQIFEDGITEWVLCGHSMEAVA